MSGGNNNNKTINRANPGSCSGIEIRRWNDGLNVPRKDDLVDGVHDPVAGLPVEVGDQGTVLIEVPVSLLVDVPVVVLADGPGLVVIGHGHQVGAPVPELVLVIHAAHLDVQEQDLLEGVGRDVTDVLELQFVEELTEGPVRRKEDREMLVFVVEDVVEPRLLDRVAEDAVTPAAGDLG